MVIKKIGITSKPGKEEVREIVPSLLRWLEERHIEAFIDRETGEALNTSSGVLAREDIPAQVDLIVVLGGDGTLLATARALHRRSVPILAVNLGGLGFLTVITRGELFTTLEALLEGKLWVEHRVQLEAELVRAGASLSSFDALNDVVLNKGAIARLVDFAVEVDGRLLSTYKADGLIVSTPTGSTAYSLAAGGPVMVPDASAFIINPICGHTLTNRAIVLPDSVRIEVTVRGPTESVYLTVDGQVAIELREQDCIRMRKAPAFVDLVQPVHRDYFEILRRKLKWGER